MTHSVLTALVGVVVFAFILYRQLRSRPVGGASGYRRPAIFAAVGIFFTLQYLSTNRVTATAVGALVVSLLVGAGLAWLRAWSVRLWHREGEWWRRGTAVTLVLWLCAIGSHLGIDALVGHLDPAEGLGRGLGNATTLLYLGLSLGLQHLVLLRRVGRLDAGRVVAPVTTGSHAAR